MHHSRALYRVVFHNKNVQKSLVNNLCFVPRPFSEGVLFACDLAKEIGFIEKGEIYLPFCTL